MMNNVTMARNKPAVVVNLTVVGNADSYPNRSFVLRPPSFAMSIGRSSSTREGKYLPDKDNGWFESRVVSRGHAVIKAFPDMKAVFVEDVGSMHGTFVNERKVDAREKTMLVTGDILRFGTDVSRGPDTFPPLRATVDYKWINERATDLPQEIQRAFDAYDDEESDIEFLEESLYKPSTAGMTRQSRTFSVPDSDVSVAGSVSDGDDIQEISASEAMSAQILAHSRKEAAEAESHTPSSSQQAKEPISPQTPEPQIEPAVDVVPETITDNLENILSPVIRTPLKKIAHADAPQTFVNVDYQPLEDENMTESDYGSHDSDEYPYEEEYSESGDGDSEDDLPAVILESMKTAHDVQPANAAPIVEASNPNTSRDTTTEHDHTLPDPQSLKSPRQTSSQPRAPSPSDAAMPKPVPTESRLQSKPAAAPPSATTFPMFPFGYTAYSGSDLGVNPSHISYDTYRLPAPPEPFWLSNQVYRPPVFTGSVPTYPSDISPFPDLEDQPSGALPENNADRQSFVHFPGQGPSNSSKTSDKAEESKPQVEKSCKKVSISEIIGEHKQAEATTSSPKQRGTKRKMDVVERDEDFSSLMPQGASSARLGSPAPIPAATPETTVDVEIPDVVNSVLEAPSIVITEAPAIEERPAKRVKTDRASKSARKVPSLVKYAAVATVSAFAGAAGLFSVLVALPDDYFVGAK